MRQIVLNLAFVGTAYHGFQIQPNAVTLFSVVQDTLKSILGENINLKGCSRTDSGVHANSFILSVYTESNIVPNSLQRAMNARLPKDIAVINITDSVDEDFHPRYSAIGKKYLYKIWNSGIKNPFLIDRVWHYVRELNIEKMSEAAKLIVGTHDFKGFSSKSSVLSTVRTIFEIDISKKSENLEILVYGDGFLYNMVRIIVGTLIGVSEGKLEVSDIEKILKTGDRTMAGITAPACGLYLHEVVYKKALF